jgi:hypothetical protein|tara:strand:- start:152 stop:514 length:363 start_codon:yes stop_codon:yes gene_type:complete
MPIAGSLFMKKLILNLATIFFSALLIIPVVTFAHDGEHKDSSSHGSFSKSEKFEEGSGTSARETKHSEDSYQNRHGAKEEGSGYKTHGEKQGNHGEYKEGDEHGRRGEAQGHMEEGSGMR